MQFKHKHADPFVDTNMGSALFICSFCGARRQQPLVPQPLKRGGGLVPVEPPGWIHEDAQVSSLPPTCTGHKPGLFDTETFTADWTSWRPYRTVALILTGLLSLALVWLGILSGVGVLLSADGFVHSCLTGLKYTALATLLCIAVATIADVQLRPQRGSARLR